MDILKFYYIKTTCKYSSTASLHCGSVSDYGTIGVDELISESDELRGEAYEIFLEKFRSIKK
ncbi:MAG: hypothetical protein KAQ87_02030 [Candidatus Pacebacteria bacterium]|nr:hypothetical protein [Candidatus Paceibacterota bacterium]